MGCLHSTVPDLDLKRRDRSAPLIKKPIFDAPNYSSNRQQFRVNRHQQFIIPKQQTYSCPQRIEQYQSRQPLQIIQQPTIQPMTVTFRPINTYYSIDPIIVKQQEISQLETPQQVTMKKERKKKQSNDFQQTQTNLQKMYEQMNTQLNTLNQLIVCLEQKIVKTDPHDKENQDNENYYENHKRDLDNFTQKVSDLGLMASETIKKSRETLLKESVDSLNSSSSLSSVRMRQNNQKIDQLIDKLQGIKQSYKRIQTEQFDSLI